jgi:hypothetical protein
MGRVGQERVRSVLAWEHSAPVLLAAYDRLWPDGGPRAEELERPTAAHRQALESAGGRSSRPMESGQPPTEARGDDGVDGRLLGAHIPSAPRALPGGPA